MQNQWLLSFNTTKQAANADINFTKACFSSKCTVLVPGDINLYLGNSHEYFQVHGAYPYIAMSHDSYPPLSKQQFNMC